MYNEIDQALNREPKTFLRNLSVFLVILVALSWGSSSLQFAGFTEAGLNVAKGVIRGLFSPNWALILNLTENGIPYLILQTIAIAILGTIIGAILAIPFSFLASTAIVPKPIAYTFRAIILLIRTIPALIWALVWIRVTGPGPFCGVVTQAVCSIGMISKMYITAIEDLDTGILESLDAMGCTTFQKIRIGILPQLSASFISTAIYRFDINLKDATILGIVGAGGIGSPLSQAISNSKWNAVGAFLLSLIVLVIIIEYCSTKIRARLAHGRQ